MTVFRKVCASLAWKSSGPGQTMAVVPTTWIVQGLAKKPYHSERVNKWVRTGFPVVDRPREGAGSSDLQIMQVGNGFLLE
jgi:hypothetical protein